MNDESQSTDNVLLLNSCDAIKLLFLALQMDEGSSLIRHLPSFQKTSDILIQETKIHKMLKVQEKE